MMSIRCSFFHKNLADKKDVETQKQSKDSHCSCDSWISIDVNGMKHRVDSSEIVHWYAY